VKYKQTVLGASWAVLVPFLQMVVFTVVFGKFANLPSEGLPQPIFYYAGLLPWTYFSTALMASSQSMAGNSALLTKIYLPRLIIPTVPCIAGLIDLAVASAVLGLMMAWYQLAPPITTLLLPLLVVLAFGTALGAGLFLAALNVRYRDIRYVVPLLVQVWMYATVILPFSAVPERLGPWRYLYGLNPMAGVVEGFRWCLFHERMASAAADATLRQPVAPPLALIALGTVVMAILLWCGARYFRRMEITFADIV
jgi:lipopolysaccharide transport system permease protein